ncbi:MAG: hypothetical protein MZV63_63120 [Marinilabiliales bacterium]|nr:hypothetical protein [Marinilabiliales bacterium]
MPEPTGPGRSRSSWTRLGAGTEWDALFKTTTDHWTRSCPTGPLFRTAAADGLVHKFDTTGNLVKTFGRKGQGPGDLQMPGALDVLDEKTLVVNDAGNRRLSLFDLDGNFMKTVKMRRGRRGDLVRPHPGRPRREQDRLRRSRGARELRGRDRLPFSRPGQGCRDRSGDRVGVLRLGQAGVQVHGPGHGMGAESLPLRRRPRQGPGRLLRECRDRGLLALGPEAIVLQPGHGEDQDRLEAPRIGRERGQGPEKY